ncbi:FAD-dependent monooxygenase [Streptomyces vilmorinianum]|uniref:FAD-dependent monooxygenase n=1 Tax=Streptomyces vilmorinianum TaxID=3051092 RepID=UPI0032E7F794
MWPTRRTFWAGRCVHQRTYPPLPVRTAPFASLPQPRIEHHLLNACRTAGIPIHWNREVVHVAAAPHGVTVRTHDGAEHTGAYLIAADGARSAVRAQLGIALDQTRSPHAFVIADVADGPPLPCSRDFHYRHPAVGGRNVLLVPFQGGWRVDLQCRPHDDPDHWTRSTPEWIGSILGAAYSDRVTWVSPYRFRQRVAHTFHDPHHRVLLAGEAAHQFPPFGARGMNSGIADAQAAARAIGEALTLSAAERDAPVAAYTDRRRTAALTNQAAAAGALAHLQADTPGARLRQRAASLAASAWPPAGAWLDRAPYGPTLRATPTRAY